MSDNKQENDMLGHERFVKEHPTVGNAAAMRDALVKIRDKCVIYNNDLAEEIDALCGDALSAPPRNCDVGTVEEQSNRFEDYCMEHKNGGSCRECSFNENLNMCALEWAQMPYEAQEGGAR